MNPRTCAVIGGQGFIGRSLVVRLLKLGNWIVRIADSAPTLSVDPHPIVSEAIHSGRASYVQVDVRDQRQLLAAIDGTLVVFYMDNKYPSACDYYQGYIYIVQGIKNAINACRECKVKRLVFNSSADVVFDGLHAIHYADESLQYPAKYQEMLNDLRAQAESLVLIANNCDGLLTCALRSSNVFGPGDPSLVPSLLDQANSFWGKFILGNGDNLCDFTYVENVAHAHICAAEALETGSVAGKAFFITNLEPMYYWDFVTRVCKSLGYQRPNIKVPAGLLGHILPFLQWLRNQLEPEYNEQLSSAQYSIQSGLFTRTYSCTAAEERLGYMPIVSLEEGIEVTIKSLSNRSNEKFPARYINLNKESKVEKLLGGGKGADILLWRNDRETFTSFVATATLFYWFFTGDWTFITSAATLLLMVSLFVFAQNVLHFDLVHFENMSWLRFQVTEVSLKDAIGTMAGMWNQGLDITRSLARGEDWNLFFKVAIPLYLLAMIFSALPCSTVLGLAAMFAFTSFFTYEQYEEEVDALTNVACILVGNLKFSLLASLPPSVSSFIFARPEHSEASIID